MVASTSVAPSGSGLFGSPLFAPNLPSISQRATGFEICGECSAVHATAFRRRERTLTQVLPPSRLCTLEFSDPSRDPQSAAVIQ